MEFICKKASWRFNQKFACECGIKKKNTNTRRVDSMIYLPAFDHEQAVIVIAITMKIDKKKKK